MATLRTALITGAAKGVGRGIAEQLAAKGFSVIIAARNGAAAAATAAEIGPKASALVMDVADPASIRNAAATLATRIERLDVLVNNAAILAEPGNTSVLDITPEQLQQSFITNTQGPLLVVQALLPLLERATGARIINVSSTAGQLSTMQSWAPAYSISKAGLNAVTKLLAYTLINREIPVNAVHPGWVRTDMGGANATLSVSEGADTAVWLATDAPSTMSGCFVANRAVIPW